MATHKSESVPEAGDSKQATRLIDAFRQELDDQGSSFYHPFDIKSSPSVQTILGLPREQQVPVVLEAVARQTENMRQFGSLDGAIINALSLNRYQGFKELISILLRKNLPFRLEDIERLIQLIADGRGYYSWQLSLAGILRVVEDFCRDRSISESLHSRLVILRDHLCAQPAYAKVRDAIMRLDQLLAPGTTVTPDYLLTTDEAWTRYLREQLDELERSSRFAWHALLLHCNTAVQSKPTRKWLQRADAFVKQIGPEAFVAILSGTAAEMEEVAVPTCGLSGVGAHRAPH